MSVTLRRSSSAPTKRKILSQPNNVTEEKVVRETELCGFQERLFFSGSTAITRVGHGEIIGDVIEKSVKTNLLICDFYNH